jgi:regulator of sigma E protease
MAGQQDLAPPPDHKPKPWEYGAKRPVVRMAIIAAGVTMNFIGGWLCYSGSFVVGRDVEPPLVGNISHDIPELRREREAGLAEGDEIISVNGDRVYTRDGLEMRIARVSPGTTVTLEVKGKDGNSKPEVKLETLERMKGISTLGFLAPGLIATETVTVQAGFTTEQRLIVEPVARRLGKKEFKAWDQVFDPADVVETANGVSCLSKRDLDQVLEKCGGRPIAMVVTGADSKRREVSVKVSGCYQVGIEFMPRKKPFIAKRVREGSPAWKAGIRSGDTILVGTKGQAVNGYEFARLVHKAGGNPLTLVVVSPNGKRKTVAVSGVFKEWYVDPGKTFNYSMRQPWGESQIVRSVDPGSMAEAKGLEPGAVLEYIEMRSDPKEPIYVTWAHRGRLRGPHRLEWLEGGSKTPWKRPTQKWLRRGVGESLAAGWNQTVETLLSTTVILKKVMNREVSAGTSLSGPVMIVTVAYRSAKKGLGRMLWLLGLIGVSLAFFNLLPIPVLDGGHLVFLGYEVVTRKSPPPRLVEMAQYAGLLIILSLFVFVFWNDISRMIRGG